MDIEKIKALNGVKPSKIKDPMINRINNYLFALYNKGTTASKPGHTASTVGTKCHRKIYYQYFRVEKDVPVDPKGARIFETGKHYEIMVMEWIKGLGEFIPYRNKNGSTPLDRDNVTPNFQFPIKSSDWRINKGYIDNIGIIDGKLWIYEIKSSNAKKFQSLEDILPEHKDQVSIYFDTFNVLLKAGEYKHIPELAGLQEASGVKILYINKDNSELKVFSLTKQDLEPNISKLKKKLNKVNKFIDSKDLPPKNPDNCQWCPFKDKCRQNINVT